VIYPVAFASISGSDVRSPILRDSVFRDRVFRDRVFRDRGADDADSEDVGETIVRMPIDQEWTINQPHDELTDDMLKVGAAEQEDLDWLLDVIAADVAELSWV
ncbi:MAG: hypothetical protein ACI9HK_004102, partial [Pirellulaceae bacterium]